MRRLRTPTMPVFNDFAHALVVVNRVMERGARTHQGDWCTLPAGFHLDRARVRKRNRAVSQSRRDVSLLSRR
jgi:hypothetical protein